MQTPWMEPRTISATLTFEDCITRELECFGQFIRPTVTERRERKEAIDRVKDALLNITKLWVGSTSDVNVEVIIHGSTATELYLPGADVDLIVQSDAIGYLETSYLYCLSNEFMRLEAFRNVQYIPASVNIVKLIDSKTNIPFDISVRYPHPRTVEWVKAVCEGDHRIYPLVLFIKLFCIANRIEKPYTGGLGGLTIVVMIVVLIRLNHTLKSNGYIDRTSLGRLLLDFFEIYERFDYYNLQIDVGSEPLGRRVPDIYDRSYQMMGYEVVFLHPLDKHTCISGPSQLYVIRPALSRGRNILEGLKNQNIVTGQSILVQLLNGFSLGNLAKRAVKTFQLPIRRQLPQLPVVSLQPRQLSNGAVKVGNEHTRPTLQPKGAAAARIVIIDDDNDGNIPTSAIINHNAVVGNTPPGKRKAVTVVIERDERGDQPRKRLARFSEQISSSSYFTQ